MTAITGTQQTYATRGNREDLSDLIYRITPTKTPFLSAIPKVKATSTLHEWQTDDLAPAAANAQIEGDDVTTFTAPVYTFRAGNFTQISSKNLIISGTQQAMKTAGRSNERAYQISKRGAELKRDMEVALTSGGGGGANMTGVAGAAATARQLRGLEGWIATNGDLGVGGAAPVYYTGSFSAGTAVMSNPGTAPTDGTAAALTESRVKNVLQKIFDQGGEPDLIMLGSSQKQTFSGFTGGSTRFDKSEDKSVTAAVDFYVSDFGTLNIVPNRFQRSRSVFILETEKWALATLRPFATEDLAKTGDADKTYIVTEYTLESRNERASGIVRDVL